MRLRDYHWHCGGAAWPTLAVALLLAACTGGDDRPAADGSGDAGGASVSRDAGTALNVANGAEAVAARGGAAGSAGFVVIRSTGPSAGGLAAGTRLEADGVVTLAAGDRLVVTDGTQTRTLSGPGRFDLGTATPATGNSIDTAQNYVAAQIEGGERSAAAATRRTAAPPGGGGPRQPPTLANGIAVQAPVAPVGSAAPLAPRPRIDAPRLNAQQIDTPRVIRPRIDQAAARVDAGTLAAAPPVPDTAVAARVAPPAAAAQQSVRRPPPQ